VDPGVFGTPTESVLKQKEKICEELNLAGKIVAVSVERIDYTKGIVERLLAIDRFLEKYPEYRKRFVFIQIAAPSRTHIKRYHDLVGEIDELVDRTNWKYSEGDWSPVIYLKRQFTHEEISPYYQLADLCIVSSLHDGMNLVAKEFIAAKYDLSGILLLSRFTGAARELTDAVPINPYAIEEFAESIRGAIEMPAEEKRRRMARMREIVSKNNVYFWAANIITELTAVQNSQPLQKE
jgi:trehalose 6-phosphate synthase